jgi:ribosomal protein S18 acetylase RimI-like enzyme
MLEATTTTLANTDSTSLPAVFAPVAVEPLSANHEAEVIEFLSQRPIHTVAMKSMIRDNGLVNSLNRGEFFGCRDLKGQLEGVALVGHATLMETVSDRALQALAQVARECPYTHMIMGEQERVKDFWKNYAEVGQTPRLACREWLLELQQTDLAAEGAPTLRLATEEELEFVMPIQGQLAFQESGVDPMSRDPEGFRQRCLRRIRQGRTWVLFEAGKLIFKADVISETDEVIYLEGIWVAEERRNDNVGNLCMTELSGKLLRKAQSICLLANELNSSALKFYRKCGFRFRATYETIFLTKKEQRPH